jgi:cyclic nucleotide gated channel
VSCTEGTFLLCEGDPVNEMVFILQGHLDSYSTGGGRTGFSNSCHSGPGDFYGEEQVTWALDARSTSILPSSTRTIKAITQVEAFAIVAQDLKFVVTQYRKLRSKQLRHKFRFYSYQWRTCVACFIQIAWHRYKKRKEAAELIRTRENDMADHELQPPQPESAFGVSHTKWGILKHSISSSGIVSSLQKPAEPDFSVDKE